MNRRKRIALATLPALALIILGSSVASAQGFRGFNETQKAALMQARELRKEGEDTKAKEILLNAGIDPSAHAFHGKGHMRGGAHFAGVSTSTRQAIHDAVAHNDYGAFTTAIAGSPFAGTVTEDNFAKLVEAFQLRESGDKKGARTLLQNLGFHGGHHGGMGGMMGRMHFDQGTDTDAGDK